MKYRIIHELPRRIRLECGRYALSPGRAAAVEQFLLSLEGIKSARASSITGSIVFTLEPSRKEAVLEELRHLDPAACPERPFPILRKGSFRPNSLTLWASEY
jgi:hypothetical protein